MAQLVRHAEFNDPRLVEVYDAECPWSRDDDFFLSLVCDSGAAHVVDLGCGTGRLALGMAEAGLTVTGVDPARASLDAARARPGADGVTWIEGTSSSLPDDSFDAAVMTSHVAQFFVDDDSWARVLGDLARSLVPGGLLTFDSRDPRDRRWDKWNPVDSARRVVLRDGREVPIWTEVTAENDGVVEFAHHYEFPTREKLVSTATLRFRSSEEISASLERAGFSVEAMYGGWRREPLGHIDGEILVVAHR
ncbi:MAG TPA: methyltransferase domain-containing protein [Mycobacteriales bacterium]|nr:methyltransferase domain-containing protein [Mycobacteriales bacterium]